MTEASSEESAAARLKEQPWSPGQKRLLTVVAVAVGMAGIDTTIVNVALPRMSTDLSLSLSGMQWVVDGYSLVYGASLLAAGVLADRIGFRKVFGIGVLAFALASMLITIAQTPGVLIGARAVQGLAAAVLTASGLAQLTAGFTGGQRARALGIYTTVGSVSFVVGPLLGGVLVDGPGWRGGPAQRRPQAGLDRSAAGLGGAVLHHVLHHLGGWPGLGRRRRARLTDRCHRPVRRVHPG
ncbi:MFS transporter [Saccharopolyspora spinosa]|uniref:MFS transporter n=1 Tax=Saccharopolyspora spinosa TaxID=60894 RepID=UPI0002379269|nr:MFS transporter [Saccharopolyspora spinosa]